MTTRLSDYIVCTDIVRFLIKNDAWKIKRIRKKTSEKIWFESKKTIERLNSILAPFRSTVRLGTDGTSVVHYSGPREWPHTPVPGEDLPEIRNVSSGDTRPRAVLTDDTINQQFLFSSLLVSGRRTFQRRRAISRGERQPSVGWHGWDGRAGKQNYCPFYCRGSNLLSLNADPPRAEAGGQTILSYAKPRVR